VVQCITWTNFPCLFLAQPPVGQGLLILEVSRGIALPFHDHCTRRGWGVSITPRPLFIPGKDPVPIVEDAGWGPGPVWIGAENLATTGIRSPDRPARSQSLYRLRYPAHNEVTWTTSKSSPDISQPAHYPAFPFSLAILFTGLFKQINLYQQECWGLADICLRTGRTLKK
jgi:hypothetical protein